MLYLSLLILLGIGIYGLCKYRNIGFNWMFRNHPELLDKAWRLKFFIDQDPNKIWTFEEISNRLELSLSSDLGYILWQFVNNDLLFPKVLLMTDKEKVFGIYECVSDIPNFIEMNDEKTKTDLKNIKIIYTRQKLNNRTRKSNFRRNRKKLYIYC